MRQNTTINWSLFYTLAKTSVEGTERFRQFEQKYGYLLNRPHVAYAVEHATCYANFVEMIMPFEKPYKPLQS